MDDIQRTYHLPLVALSIVIAIIASYTAVDMASRMVAARGIASRIKLWAGAVTMGIGVWSVHFIAMHAVQMQVHVSYSWKYVFVSILPAMASFGIAMFGVARDLTRLGALRLGTLLLGGLLLGGGIVAMHFTGMKAIRIHAETDYDPFLVVLSAVIAVGASWAALFVLFQLRRGPRDGQSWRRKMSSAVLMAIAIVGMHYTGLAAMDLTPMDVVDLDDSASISSWGMAYAIIELGPDAG